MKAEKLNRTVFIRDNLEVLRILEDKSVDLIYLDPPFNSNKNYGALIDSKLTELHFKDVWNLSDIDKAWYGELSENHPNLYQIIHAVGCINGNSDKSYLIYMAIRLIEMKRILNESGSIYLHCDHIMSHSLKLIMDSIFSKKNFNNNIIWEKNKSKGARSIAKRFGRQSDHILFYSKNKKFSYYKSQFIKDKKYKSRYKFKDKHGRLYSRDCPLGNYSKKSIEKFEKQGRIYVTKNGKKSLIRYLDEVKGRPITNMWTDINSINTMAKERTGYSTQKPIALLERIIKASCPKDGIVLDPFCGCATTCIASEKLNRKWIGIDISPLTGQLLRKRLKKELNLSENLGIIQMDLPIKNVKKPSKNIRHILYGKQEGYCKGCAIHFQIVNLTVDHIIPRSKGGQDTYKNLQLLCQCCNLIKN